MSMLQDTQFSKKSNDMKKFDIDNLNFTKLGIKMKNPSNIAMNHTLQEETLESMLFILI